MFAVTIAGDADDAVQRISSALRGRRFRVETLVERRASPRRSPSDGLVVVAPTSDRLRVTRVVLEARRDDDVRFLPFALVARALEKSAATAFGAKALVKYDGSAEELVTEIRRMLLREQENAVLVHQLEGELGSLGVGDVLETLARGRRSAVVRVSSGASRGAIAVRAGQVVSAAFDERTGRDALSALLALRHGRFRAELRTVEDTDELGALDVDTARAVLERRGEPRKPSTPAPSPADERAPVAALAAALMNAVAANARRFLGESVVARALEQARADAAREVSSLDGFRVTNAGVIVVERLEAAAEAGAWGLGIWMGRALDRLDELRPGRFGRSTASETVGGLSRLLDQVGWRADFEAALGGVR